MKAICVKESISDAVLLTEKVSQKNPTLPVLGCVLLKTDKKSLIIQSTNLELGLEITIPTKILKEGSVAIPGNILHTLLISNSKNEHITLEVVNGNLKVSSENTNAIIKSIPHNDFPIIPKTAQINKITLNTKNIIKGLQSVSFSAATSPIKPELGSVYVHNDNKNLIFVSTDSFRLSEKTLQMKNIKEIDPLLIPIRNVQDIIKTLEYIGDEDVEVFTNKNQIIFKNDNIYLTSRLIDGVFPDYNQIIPKKPQTEIIILKQDFIDGLRKVNVFSDKTNHMHISANPEDKKFVISTDNKDVGEIKDVIPAKISGEASEINFNYRYITEALGSIHTESITITLNGIGKPLIMRGVNDPSYFYLVMPMNR